MNRSLAVLVLLLTVTTLTACSGTDPKSVAASLPALPSEKVDLEMAVMELPLVEEGQELPAPTQFTQVGRDYMTKYMMDPAEKINGLVDKDDFSRCGSGASYVINSIPKDKTSDYLGTVFVHKGCGQSEKFFDFRVSQDGQKLELSNVGEDKFVPYKEWFKTAKPVEFGLDEGYEGGA